MTDSDQAPDASSASPVATKDTKQTVDLRSNLVKLVAAHYPTIIPATAAALQSVPRHLFLPEVPLEQAYADAAIATKKDDDGIAISSASQPTMIAIMLDQLQVQPGMRIMEIGAGTGYNAALLATLAGPAGHVTTIDLDEAITAAARQHLTSAGFGPEHVTVMCGDGAQGWQANAPYDRVILTVGAWDVMPAWFAHLADGGRIVAPLAIHTVQMSMALTRRGDTLVTNSLQPCGFMRLRGPFAGPESFALLPESDGLRLLAEPPLPPIAQLAALLRTPPRTRQLNDVQTAHMRLALALMDTPLVSLIASTLHPTLGHHATGIVTPEGDSACWIVLDGVEGTLPIVAEYGAATAALQMEAMIDEWRSLGQPALNQWHLTLYPKGKAPAPSSPHDYLITKEFWDITTTCLE